MKKLIAQILLLTTPILCLVGLIVFIGTHLEQSKVAHALPPSQPFKRVYDLDSDGTNRMVRITALCLNGMLFYLSPDDRLVQAFQGGMAAIPCDEPEK